jgi:hypothetical protein
MRIEPPAHTRGAKIAFVLVLALEVVLSAQEAVVSNDRATAMKASYPYVRFSLLASFDVPALDEGPFALSPHAASAQASGTLAIPLEVAALDGRNVSVRGFMLPVDTDAGRVTRFILTATIDSCHFGMIGQANEWILVTLPPGRHVPFPRATPITVFGRLDVEPRMRGDRLAGLYEMLAEAITVH